jgi:hypothetical protein
MGEVDINDWWLYLFENKNLTFKFLKERVINEHYDSIPDSAYAKIFENEFSVDRERFLWEYRRKQFNKLGGIFNEIVERVCKPPILDCPDYDAKMDAFIMKMHHLGFESFV